MADAYARLSGELGVLSGTPGPGPDQRADRHHRGGQEPHPAADPGPRGDQPAIELLPRRRRAGHRRRRGPRAARCRGHRRRGPGPRLPHRRRRRRAEHVLLQTLPLDVQAAGARRVRLPALAPAGLGPRPAGGRGSRRSPRPEQSDPRAVFSNASRGARNAGKEIKHLSERTGALLATSAVSRGLFRDAPFSLDVSGGFATPVAADLIKDADLLVGWGCALNMWTAAARHARSATTRPWSRSTSTLTRSARTTGSTSASPATRRRRPGRSTRSWTSTPADRRRRGVAAGLPVRGNRRPPRPRGPLARRAL